MIPDLSLVPETEMVSGTLALFYSCFSVKLLSDELFPHPVFIVFYDFMTFPCIFFCSFSFLFWCEIVSNQDYHKLDICDIYLFMFVLDSFDGKVIDLFKLGTSGCHIPYH